MTPIGHSGLVFLALLALLNIGAYARNSQLRLAAGVVLIGMGLACLGGVK